MTGATTTPEELVLEELPLDELELLVDELADELLDELLDDELDELDDEELLDDELPPEDPLPPQATSAASNPKAAILGRKRCRKRFIAIPSRRCRLLLFRGLKNAALQRNHFAAPGA